MSETTTTTAAPSVRKVTEDPIATMAAEIDAIGLTVATGFTLADAIRLGEPYTDQAHNWGSKGAACALSSARIAAQAIGYLPR